MMQKTLSFLQKEQILLGVLSLVWTLGFSLKVVPFDLMALIGVGLFLSATLYLKGALYSILLTALFAGFKHFFFVTDHLYQVGIESSLCFAFLIIALTFQELAHFQKSLKLQIETKDSSLSNLEEELVKLREEQQSQQMAFQEKVAHLQKELDELQLDHSSILILNEVLRKKSAHHMQEAAAATKNLSEGQRQYRNLREELIGIEKELARVKATDDLAIENRALMKELNAARYEKEVISLMNETLTRLQRSEKLKTKEIEEELSSVALVLSATKREIYEQVKQSETESLYKQLKVQFEEKAAVLHQVRSELFRANTELERLQIECQAFERSPLPKEVEEELVFLSQELLRAEEENGELQEMVSLLSGSPQELAKRKKKVKMSSAEQELLF
jgi:hypothetical protein